MSSISKLRNRRLLIALALLSVYFVWGSTYLALRFGLDGFPPLTLNGIRFLLAGIVMYLLLRLRGAPSPTRRQVWNATRMGVLLLVGGVGGMGLALQAGIGSGVAATAAAAIPVWSALAGGFFGSWPARREWIGLGVGLVGVLVLVQEGDFQASPGGLALAVLSPLVWSIGAVWGSNRDMPKGAMSATVQLLTAGPALLVIGPLLGERIDSVPSSSSILSLLYLTVFGSIVAYTAFVFLLKSVRPALATSYAYVNPLVAVALGLTLGGEIITGPIVIALPLILAGVGLVATSKERRPAKPRTRHANEPITETAA